VFDSKPEIVRTKSR